MRVATSGSVRLQMILLFSISCVPRPWRLEHALTHWRTLVAVPRLWGTEGAVDLTQWFERMETVFCISNCTMENQVKFATCTLMGTALTWWNSHARTLTNEVAYAMTWSDVKMKMKTKYYLRNEIKKIEAE
ncbi:reverse transcriptase domain-containing protein, partial [Tanacetum coccineum]